MSDVQAIPPGCAAVLPYLVIKNAATAFDFYQKAFGAETIMRMNMPSGAVMHAEMRIGSATFMFSEQSDEWGLYPSDLKMRVSESLGACNARQPGEAMSTTL